MRYLDVGEGAVVLNPNAPNNFNALLNFCFYQSKILVALVFFQFELFTPLNFGLAKNLG